MARRSRAAAADAVTRSVTAYDVAMLAAERTCSEAMADQFTRATRLLTTAARRDWRDPSPTRAASSTGARALATSQVFLDAVEHAAAYALAGSRVHVVALAAAVVDLAVEHSTVELTACADTLATTRYAGVVDQALARVADRAPDARTDALAQYAAPTAALLADVRTQARAQLAAARRRDDLLSVVVARLCSPTVLTLPDNHGRGLLWRLHAGRVAASGLLAISLGNTVRAAALEAFNTAAATR